MGEKVVITGEEGVVAGVVRTNRKVLGLGKGSLVFSNRNRGEEV